MPTHIGRQGKAYNLAPQPFAGGGEGDIYEITNAVHLVAKKYKPKRATIEREQKIIAMLGNPPSAKEIGQFTWPVDLLYENRQFAGYVMPRLNKPRALNEVYVYDDRKGITWDFYISVAKNLAAAIHCVHEIGHVCGDLNPDNISVDNQGFITLLDTDSYHIYDKVNNRTFRCEVGRPEYVPRELQGLHLGSAPLPTYTEETDNFTLAVLIFCLLMNGSHPFACAVTRQSVSASKFQPVGNIAKGLFPFMQTQTGLSIPSYAPPLAILTDELQELFKRVFVDGHRNPKARPKPDEWYYALDHLNRSLKKCAKDNTHLYYAGLNDCPWCEVEQKMKSIYAAGASNGSQTATTGAVATGATTPALQIRLSSTVYQQYLSVFGVEVADATAVTVLSVALIVLAIWLGFLVGRIKTGCFLNGLAVLGIFFLFLFAIMIPLATGIPIAPYFHIFALPLLLLGLLPLLLSVILVRHLVIKHPNYALAGAFIIPVILCFIAYLTIFSLPWGDLDAIQMARVGVMIYHNQTTPLCLGG